MDLNSALYTDLFDPVLEEWVGVRSGLLLCPVYTDLYMTQYL